MKYTVTVIADVLQTQKRTMTVIADDEKQVREKIRNYEFDVLDCAFNGDKENVYDTEKIQHMDVERIEAHPEATEEQKRMTALEHRIQSLLRDLEVIHNNDDQVPFEGDWLEMTVDAVKNELGIEIEDE